MGFVFFAGTNPNPSYFDFFSEILQNTKKYRITQRDFNPTEYCGIYIAKIKVL